MRQITQAFWQRRSSCLSAKASYGIVAAARSDEPAPATSRHRPRGRMRSWVPRSRRWRPPSVAASISCSTIRMRTAPGVPQRGRRASTSTRRFPGASRLSGGDDGSGISALYETGGDREDVGRRSTAPRPGCWRTWPRASRDGRRHLQRLGARLRHPGASWLKAHQLRRRATSEQIDELVELQIDRLERYESVDGGWGYYDFRYQTSSRPATRSRSSTRPSDRDPRSPRGRVCTAERLIARAIAATLRQQQPDFSYLYGEYLKWQPMPRHQPTRRQPRPLAGLQPRAAACGANRTSPTRC